jgi:enterochelin esterase-like enzyme
MPYTDQGRTGIWVVLLVSMGLVTAALSASDDLYSLGPDSERQDGVPTGKVTEHVWRSEVFPETIRRYWTYVPAQYDGSEEAAVMVFQDGHAYVDPQGLFRATVVLDNLIHRGELPVIVGIFIDPGHRGDALPEQPGWRPTPSNRRFE